MDIGCLGIIPPCKLLSSIGPGARLTGITIKVDYGDPEKVRDLLGEYNAFKSLHAHANRTHRHFDSDDSIQEHSVSKALCPGLRHKSLQGIGVIQCAGVHFGWFQQSFGRCKV